MIVNAGYRGKVGAAVQKFTYTGQYNVRKDGVVELLTSGTIVFLEPKVIDVFMVGGGGAGGYGTANYNANQSAGGGAGGYTRTIKKLSVLSNQEYTVIVGAGASVPPAGGINAGGASSFGDYTVNGGSSARATNDTRRYVGGDGGSGGGAGVDSNTILTTGGSDGSNGTGATYISRDYIGGAGQGSTTREFGEETGKLYAGAGGGGKYIDSSTPIQSPGGSGGGGAGACKYSSRVQTAGAGGANTGGGGGGGVGLSSSTAGAGGSGIVCFREAQELPELAGTWVLNERLYAPESDVYFTNQDFTIGNTSNPNSATVRNLICTTAKIVYTTTMGYTYTLYTFSSNTWGTNKYTYLTFPAGATASDEFRAWLASNAIKQ